MDRNQTITLARELFLTESNIYGCAETSFMVLKKAFALPNPEDTSAAMALNGGVAWWGSTCGAITGAALAVGQLAAKRSPDHKSAKRISRLIISRLLTDFVTEKGSFVCKEIINLDIRKPDEHARFIKEGIWRDVCMNQIVFVVSKLYSLSDETKWENLVRELSSSK
jgi:C_GCAxxG_C_C family probable redox protein